MLSRCQTPAQVVLSVSLAGVEEVWGVVLQRAAQIHPALEEQQSPGAAAPALAGRARARQRREQPLLHLGQGKRLVIPPRKEVGEGPGFSSCWQDPCNQGSSVLEVLSHKVRGVGVLWCGGGFFFDDSLVFKCTLVAQVSPSPPGLPVLQPSPAFLHFWQPSPCCFWMRNQKPHVFHGTDLRSCSC